MNNHAQEGLGGSVAARTLACPGWRKLPGVETSSSSYADEGTLLHEAIALLMESDNVSTILGMKYREQVMTKELIEEKLLPALDYFDSLGDVEYVTEQRVELKSVPGAFGTADVLGRFDDGDTLVLDWKFGHNLVEVEENAQLLYYGAAALESYPEWFKYSHRVTLAIVQPQGMATWRTTTSRLRRFAKEFALAVKAGEQEFPVYETGAHCKYCPKTLHCPAMREIVEGVNTMAPIDWPVALSQVSALEQWIDTVKKGARDKLLAGEAIRGWKLVKGRGHRRWVDEELALSAYPDIQYSKLLSPAQAEKKLKCKLDPTLVETPETAPTLAPESDRRPAIEPIGLSLGKALKEMK